MSTTIKLIGADERFNASVTQLLKLKTKDHFVLDMQGEITLIDADSLEGKKSAERSLDDRTILLTVLPEQFQHVFVLKKPIKVDEFLKMLEEVVKLPNKAHVAESITEDVVAHDEVVGNPFAKFMTPGYLAEQKKQKAALLEKDKKAEIIFDAPIEPFCANFSYWQEDVMENRFLKKYYFDEIFEQLTVAQSNEMASQYGDDDGHIYSMPDYASLMVFNDIGKSDITNKIYYIEYSEGIIFFFDNGVLLSNLSVEQMINFSKVKKNEIEIKYITTRDTFLSLLNQFERYYYGDTLAILSCMILLGAKGRIINGQDVKESIGLMKLEENSALPTLMPYSKEMDNIWCFRNVSLRDTVELLVDVNPYHVFSYYTLCCLYGFFDQKGANKKTNKHLDLNALLSELQKL